MDTHKIWLVAIISLVVLGVGFLLFSVMSDDDTLAGQAGLQGLTAEFDVSSIQGLKNEYAKRTAELNALAIDDSGDFRTGVRKDSYFALQYRINELYQNEYASLIKDTKQGGGSTVTDDGNKTPEIPPPPTIPVNPPSCLDIVELDYNPDEVNLSIEYRRGVCSSVDINPNNCQFDEKNNTDPSDDTCIGGPLQCPEISIYEFQGQNYEQIRQEFCEKVLINDGESSYSCQFRDGGDDTGIGDLCDIDTDYDGFLDQEETAAGTDPYNPDSFPATNTQPNSEQAPGAASQTEETYDVDTPLSFWEQCSHDPKECSLILYQIAKGEVE